MAVVLRKTHRYSKPVKSVNPVTMAGRKVTRSEYDALFKVGNPEATRDQLELERRT